VVAVLWHRHHSRRGEWGGPNRRVVARGRWQIAEVSGGVGNLRSKGVGRLGGGGAGPIARRWHGVPASTTPAWLVPRPSRCFG